MEDLNAVARHAFLAVADHCSLGNTCIDYHRIWPLARIANLNGPTLSGHQFFELQLKQIGIENPAPRILVSGGADTGVLALAMSAFIGSAINPYVIFVDRCKTPVLLNQELIDRNTVSGCAIASNIFDIDIDAVDVIVAHSFLLYIEKQNVQNLFGKWASLLKPGGKLLLSNMVGAVRGQDMSVTEAQLARQEIQRIVKAATNLGFGDEDLKSIKESCARIFSKKLTDHPLLTIDQIKQALKVANFELLVLSQHDRSQLNQRGPLSQAMNYSGLRVEICAVKK